jgi:predicted RNase H-like HicB family nuclease
MAKIFKFEGYVVDYNDDFETCEQFLDYIDSRNRYCSITAFNQETSKEFEWDDGLKVNRIKCNKEDLEEYFDKDNEGNLLGASIEYNGFSAIIKWSEEDKVYWGRISDIDDCILIEGTTIEEIQKDMELSIEEYLKIKGEMI